MTCGLEENCKNVHEVQNIRLVNAGKKLTA